MNSRQINALRNALEEARAIAALDKTDGIAHSGDAYAHALGRANGLAASIVIELEYVLEGTGDPTPWCVGCGAARKKDCHCGGSK